MTSPSPPRLPCCWRPILPGRPGSGALGATGQRMAGGTDGAACTGKGQQPRSGAGTGKRRTNESALQAESATTAGARLADLACRAADGQHAQTPLQTPFASLPATITAGLIVVGATGNDTFSRFPRSVVERLAGAVLSAAGSAQPVLHGP